MESVEATAADPTGRWRRLSHVSLACVCVGTVVVLGAIKLVRPLGQTFTMSGDVAFIELAVRQALHHGNAVGVYSRFGWHHPGPAYLYLQAPWYWLSGESARSLFLGTWLINGASALAAVCIVRTRADERAARALAVAVFVYAALEGVRRFIDPWNPKVLALPMLLLMVSVAAAYSGSAWSFVTALVVASYLVQTHLGTLPACLGFLALATFGFWRSRTHGRKGDPEGDGESRPEHFRRAPLVVAISLLTLMWIGPVVQELTSSNGNLTQIARFYVHPKFGPTSHTLKASIITISNHASVIGFGVAHDTHGHSGRLVLTGGFILLGVAVAFVGRRRAPFVAALGLTTTIGLVVAVLAATRVIGPQDSFLFYWTEILPIPALAAAGWLAMDIAKTGVARTAVEIVSAAAVVVCLAFSVRAVAVARPTTLGDVPAARAIAAGIEHEVGTKDRPFTLHVGTTHVDQGSLTVELDKDGYRFRLEPAVDLYDGNVARGIVGPTFELRTPGTPAPANGPRERFVATIARVDISVHP